MPPQGCASGHVAAMLGGRWRPAEIDVRGLRLADSSTSMRLRGGGRRPRLVPTELQSASATAERYGRRQRPGPGRRARGSLRGLAATCGPTTAAAGRRSPTPLSGARCQRARRRQGAARPLADEARKLDYAAMMFNLVFERNPARRLWEVAGFREIGRVPRAIDVEQDALIYFASLGDPERCRSRTPLRPCSTIVVSCDARPSTGPRRVKLLAGRVELESGPGPRRGRGSGRRRCDGRDVVGASVGFAERAGADGHLVSLFVEPRSARRRASAPGTLDDRRGLCASRAVSERRSTCSSVRVRSASTRVG